MIPMKDFKKVSSDEHKSVLVHPKGHKITIAHAGISKKMREELHQMPMQKMAFGGMADDGSSDPKMKYADQYQDVFKQQRMNNPGEPEAFSRNSALEMAEQSKTADDNKAMSQVDDSKSGMDRILEENKRLAAIGAPQLPVPNMQTGPSDLDKQMADQTTPGLGTPQPPQMGQQDMMGGYGASLNQGLAQEASGIRGEASALGKLGAEQAKINQGAQEQQQGLLNDYNNQMTDLQSERQNLIKDVADSHINPNHYFDSMGTGQRISSAIGLILGGIGGGLTHQENPAQKFINSQIDNDIAAQKANLGKKESLLSHNLQAMGNLRDATTMTKIMQADIVSHQLAEAAAKSSDPLAKARAEKEIGALKVQTAPMQHQIAMNQMLMKTVAGEGAASAGDGEQFGQYLNKLRILDPKRAEEIAKRYIPGVGVGTIEIPEAKRSEISARSEVDNKLSRLIQFSEKHSGSLDPAIIKQGAAMAANAQDALRQANAQGVFKESESEFMERSLKSDPTAFFSNIRAIPGYKQVKTDNISALKTLKKSYGFHTPEGKVVEQGWKK